MCDFLCKYGLQTSAANSLQCNNSHKVLRSVYSNKGLQVQPLLYIYIYKEKTQITILRKVIATLLKIGPALIQEQNWALMPFCTFDGWGDKIALQKHGQQCHSHNNILLWYSIRYYIILYNLKVEQKWHGWMEGQHFWGWTHRMHFAWVSQRCRWIIWICAVPKLKRSAQTGPGLSS